MISNKVYTDYNMDSEYNLIQKILDNRSDYIELRITDRQTEHFMNNNNEYLKLYGNFDYLTLIKNAMTKNEHISELFMISGYSNQCIFANRYSVNHILSIRMFKSIYIHGYSSDVFDYLIENKNDNLEKLAISSMFSNVVRLRETLENHKLLKSLNLPMAHVSLKQEIDDIFELINKANVTELILSFSSLSMNCNFFEKYEIFVLNNKTLRKLQIKFPDLDEDQYNSFFCAVTKNYTIIDFKINDGQDQTIIYTMNRNKKYIMTILLCMNRRIIPRCVFRDLVLDHII